MSEFKRRSTDVATNEIGGLNLRRLDTRRAREGVPLSRLDDGMEFSKDDEVETLKTSLRAHVLGEAEPVKEEPSQSLEADTVKPEEHKETPEFSLEQFVKASYPKARAGLLDGEKLCTPEQIPSEKKVLAKLKTLSKEKLEVVREMKVPMLVLEPKGLSYKKFMKNLDTGTGTMNDTVITDSRKKQFDLQDKALGIKGDGKITDWTMGIAEGEEELDGETGYLNKLTNNWKEGKQAKKGAVLVDHIKFALMQKQAIMSRRRLDRINWSVLSRRDNNNETVCEDRLVSGGDCYAHHDHVYFYERGPYAHCDLARFRVAVTA